MCCWNTVYNWVSLKRSKSSVQLLTWFDIALCDIAECWIVQADSLSIYWRERDKNKQLGRCLCLCHIMFHTETLWGWIVIDNDEARRSKQYCKPTQLTHSWSITHSDEFPSHSIACVQKYLKMLANTYLFSHTGILNFADVAAVCMPKLAHSLSVTFSFCLILLLELDLNWSSEFSFAQSRRFT